MGLQSGRTTRANETVHRFQYKGNNQGTIRTLISITTRAKGTPILTKSINRYWPGAITSMFTGEEIGVINAVDAARATIMAKG